MTSRIGGLFPNVSPIDKVYEEAQLWGGESDQVGDSQEGVAILLGIVHD